MNPSDLGATIRQHRKLLRLTQQDLAELVGVNRRLISEVERGSDGVSLRNLLAICEALGLDLSVRSRYRRSRSYS